MRTSGHTHHHSINLQLLVSAACWYQQVCNRAACADLLMYLHFKQAQKMSQIDRKSRCLFFLLQGLCVRKLVHQAQSVLRS